MRKTALLIALSMLVTAPALAAEKKKRKTAVEYEKPLQQVDPNEASWRLVKGSLPIFLPSWAIPVQQAIEQQNAAAEPKPATKKAKRKKAAAQ
jgi:hypothetical protein